jgi:alcohol dehydrogenase class IV
MQFDFLNLPEIIFGAHRLNELVGILPRYGNNFLFIGSANAIQTTMRSSSFFDNAIDKRLALETHIVKGEPTIQVIDECVELAIELKVDGIIGLGGGSAVDAGKAVAGIYTNGGSARDYMEVIGKGSIIDKLPLPYIAVPTTAGTGSEVTKNAVVLAKDEQLKASIRSPLLIPKLAILDPALMTSVPPAITASCGMDALTQLIEAFTSKKAQPITDTLALAGIKKVHTSLVRSFKEGSDLQARTDMAYASLLSGICLANAGLGAVHGFASPVGGHDIPHGMICASLLPSVVEANLHELKTKNNSDTDKVLAKYFQLAKVFLSESSSLDPDPLSELIKFFKRLSTNLEIPKLSQLGVDKNDFPILVEKAKRSSSMKYNPIELDEDMMTRILRNSL